MLSAPNRMPRADDRPMNRLPVSGQPWPPPDYDPIAYQFRLWSAWLSGDPQMLSWVYYNLGANSPVGRAYFSTTGERGLPQPRPGQYRGGLLGSIQRTFWGQPVPPGEKRVKYHVPLAGDIAATSSDLLFSRAPVVTAPGDPGTQKALDDMYDDGTHATLLEAAELCSALGGTFLRVVWDTEVAPWPWIDKVRADAAVPHFSYNRLSSVTFWRVLSDDGNEVVRHLETHIPGQNRIMHEVYVGDQSDLGRIYPLSDFPQTAQFAQYLTAGDSIVFPDMPDGAPSVVYIPNMRPNRIWEDLGPQATPLGRSDYSGAESLLDALDETMTSWMRDIQLGKSRLIVPQGYVDSIGRGKGAVFDPDRQVYSPIASLAGAGTSDIVANQFKIRYIEHQKTIEKLVAEIARRAGYSTQDFGEETAAVAMTATEIEARARRSLITRDKKILYWRPALRDIFLGLLAVRRGYFGDRSVSPIRPTLDFAEVVLPDPLQMAQTANQLAAANAASKQVLVQMLHPDWTQAEVDSEVDLIAEELGWEALGRARITLKGPDTETLGQEIGDLAHRLPPPTGMSQDVPGLRDTGQGGEGGANIG